MRSSLFASVKLTIFLITCLTALVLIGAWCPQKSQVGYEKVVEQFGSDTALILDKIGITDVFHSNLFLGVIALLTVNMIACSTQRVFPKIKLYRKPLLHFNSQQISKLPCNQAVYLSKDGCNILELVSDIFKKSGMNVVVKDNKINGQRGKISKFAATVTHIGLLSLLFGVTITSWTGFSGIDPVGIGSNLDFTTAEHANNWLGKLPNFKIRLNSTRKENYPTGEVKQWYSNLSVLAPSGKTLLNQTISVNEPLSFNGVDVYQSSWGLGSAEISFNGHVRKLLLRPMGSIWAAFLPLEQDTVLIMSFRNEKEPMKLFAKRKEWASPKLLTEIPLHGCVNLGMVRLCYKKINPVSGLQFKSDPGLPIVYIAFGFIITGVILATIPYSEIYACLEEYESNRLLLTIGGLCPKAPSQFNNLLISTVNSLPSSLNFASEATGIKSEQSSLLVN